MTEEWKEKEDLTQFADEDCPECLGEGWRYMPYMDLDGSLVPNGQELVVCSCAIKEIKIKIESELDVQQ